MDTCNNFAHNHEKVSTQHLAYFYFSCFPTNHLGIALGTSSPQEYDMLDSYPFLIRNIDIYCTINRKSERE